MCDDGGAKPAKWQNWADPELSVEVWRAVALSLGCEPATVPGLDFGWLEDPFVDCPCDFRERLEVACYHAENGALGAVGLSEPAFRKIPLIKFAAWASAPPRNWWLPSKFPRLPNSRSSDDTESASGTIEAGEQAETYRTGLAGRPSSWDLIKSECQRRYKAGERYQNDRTTIESPSKWAHVLIEWLESKKQGAAMPTSKTLTNKLGKFLRELAAGTSPSGS